MTKELTVSKRNAKTNREILSSYKAIPGIMYGNVKEPISIFINLLEFKKLYAAAGKTEQVMVEVDGAKYPAMIHAVQLDAVSNAPSHVDFKVIDATHKLTIKVPIRFVGEADAHGDVLKLMHEIEVEALPSNMPHDIEVDISKLENEGDTIHVSDIKLGDGVEILNEADEVIVTVSKHEEETLEESAPVDFSKIEVVGKTKADDAETSE